MDFLAEAQGIKKQLIRLRRDFHMHPELGMEEHRTSSIVEADLKSLGIKTARAAGTGVIGLLRGKSPGKTVALRADMDALPLSDEKKVEYASKVPGKMHACGHDAHTACLLGAAMLLSKCRGSLSGNVKFFFQPAEETVGGALPMIEQGAMDDPHVDAVFGLHSDVAIPAGSIGVIYGKANAASDMFDAVIYGRGSHGAAPHGGVDAIAVGVQAVSTLQNIVSRSVDPIDSAVVTVGVFQGGYQRNIIADQVKLSGIIRTLEPHTREMVKERVESTIKGVAETMGARAEVEITPSYPCLVNDDAMVDMVRAVAKDTLGEDKVIVIEKPSMGVEDFAYFLQKAPGAFFYLGVRNEEKGIIHPAHSSLFDIDEDALPVGAAMMAGMAAEFLKAVQ